MATFVGRFKIGHIGYMYSHMFLLSQAENEILGGGYYVHCFFNQTFFILSSKYMLRVPTNIYFRRVHAMINRSRITLCLTVSWLLKQSRSGAT